MTPHVSGTAGLRLVPHPISHGFIAMAIRPWQLLARKMAERKTRMSLSALDDHLLKDIGISRSIIDRIARNPAGGHTFIDRAGNPTSTTPQPN
jgi:uncharacterized protein YjiS (DUF1127 family)